LLVEQGIIGLILFAGIFGACAWTIFHSAPPHGPLYGVLLLTWLVGGLSGSPESMKFTWVLFGLVSAQTGLAGTVGDVSTRRTSTVHRQVAEHPNYLPGKEHTTVRRPANTPA
jgi:hypothetical protein